ncbi:geranylgeranylglycerol-phosphate geranylgeranyltransferase [Aureisphaera galaxeae]|uniref:geranylgeranylglycerol-phosphate geranylgeranyltransferase n=1 Tax=Aureisphaera galaxeae TaxID=1538023 RepID=UPI002350502A|nr:geranylgeranylglycerol-phosphate geranylgeranyltransferase [Aureisphaera galaxeae]MDC8003818.1 geranylgeranylglycerol-phosphate geranylgeranyltransferase [Aureisphaera galaxeae]
MLPYIKLLRPVNLLLIVLVQCLIKFALFDTWGVETTLNNLQFALLVIITIIIAGAGNVVNDIFDEAVDRINKPEKMIVWRLISEKTAYNYYIILNVIGVGLGFYLANTIDHAGLTAIFIIISALLYIYATHIKSMLLVGNVLVSILVAMSLIVLILFDIYPAITDSVSPLQVKASKVILFYAGFAFFINLMREIVKDLQDIDGDKNGGRNSLPIVLGRARTVNAVFAMGVLAMVSILWFTYIRLYNDMWLSFYFVFLIAAPLLFFCIKAWNAENKKDFSLLSLLLKIIMLLGVCSLPLFAKYLMSL